MVAVAVAVGFCYGVDAIAFSTRGFEVKKKEALGCLLSFSSQMFPDTHVA